MSNIIEYLGKNSVKELVNKILERLDTKVNKETGKGLSTNDYTTDEKNKLAGITTGANKYTLPVATSSAIGGVKSGTDITVDASGNVSINDDSHNHTIANIDDLQTTLNGKASSTHTHDSLYDVKGAADAALESANAYTDESVNNLSEGFSNVIYQMYGSDMPDSEEGGEALTIRQIANDEASAVSDDLSEHINNTTVHITSSERTKLSGIETGAQKNSITGVKGDSESAYRTGNVNITPANIGLGNVNNTSDANKPVSTAQQTAIDTALATAKSYTDTKTSGLISSATVDSKVSTHNASTSAHNDIRNLIADLSTKLNNFLDVDDTTTDQLSEVITLINNNKGTLESLTSSKVNVSDIVNNLTTNSSSKVLSAAQGVAIKGLIDALQEELDNHAHEIADVSGLQSALDAKAASSHGTHVTYSSTNPVMDGTASVGSATTVARSDHKHPTDTTRAAASDLTSHTGNTTVHITAAERTNWNAANTHAGTAHAPSNAEKNQNAFSNIKVGSTTIAADTTTDTLELAGSNVTITPDATNDKVTIAVADGSTSTKGVLQLTNSTSSTSTTTAATPSSVKSAYDLANTANTAAAAAQKTADGKANASHGNHVPATETANNAKFLRNDNTWQTVTPANIGAAPTSHTHSAYANQNAFSKVTVGTTTIEADTTTDTLTLVAGTNVTITPDATNDKVTIAATDTVYTHPTTSGNKHIPSGGSSGQILRWSADGTAVWGADNNTVYTHPAYTARTGVPAANASPGFGGTFTVSQPVSDGTGHVTAINSRTITIPSAVASTSANGLMSTTDKTKLDSINIAYATCDTEGATVAKVATVVSGTFKLVAGAIVAVKFTNASGVASPTLNVDGSGAKPIYRYATTAASTGTTTTGWRAGAVQLFIYDGTGWVRDFWENTTYSNASLGQGYGTCSTAAATVAKVVTLSSYSLTTGGVVAVKFTNSVPANATLNINSKGAKAIYYQGAAITAGIINAGETATFLYNGTYYHLIAIDRKYDAAGSASSALSSAKSYTDSAISLALADIEEITAADVDAYFA